MNTHHTNKGFRSPNHYGKIGLGLGLDIKWGNKVGFIETKNGYLTSSLKNFIKKTKIILIIHFFHSNLKTEINYLA